MLVEERTRNAGSMGCTALVPCGNGTVINGHKKFVSEGHNADGSFGEYSEYSAEGLRTYKRRKHLRLTAGTNLQENGRGPGDAASQADLSITKSKDIILHKNSYELAGCSRVDTPAILDGSDDCRNGHWRRIVLELILRSLSVSEGGIQSCIQEAIMSSTSIMSKMNCAYPKIARAQEPGHCHENILKINSQLHKDSKVPDRECVWKEHGNTTSNASQNEANNQADVHHVTELCQRVLHNVVVSEKFGLFCKLLCERFQGIKVDSFLDFSVMNSRMKDGAYEKSPVLFSRDLQEVWHKIQKIGNEMVFLSKVLSDISQNSYSALVGSSTRGTSEEGKNEEFNHVGGEQNTGKQFSVPESDHETKPEQTEVRGSEKINCRQCGVKADGKDRLVCDSCEEMYHVSCIEPALEEIPSRSWYCANCTGIVSPHENCVVCERLNVPETQINGSGEIVPMEEDMPSDFEESSDCSEDGSESNGNRRLFYCTLCGIEEEDRRRLRACGHYLCPNKYYHLRCLTTEELKSYGRIWYCPSCLCRVCHTDQDDDKIVLCDGCDHAFHIYCLEPPLTSIPKGKWFCSLCDAGIQAIHKAKKAYENLEKQGRKQLGRLNEAVGSVDMLLNAAEKLKCEEKLAATRKKR